MSGLVGVAALDSVSRDVLRVSSISMPTSMPVSFVRSLVLEPFGDCGCKWPPPMFGWPFGKRKTPRSGSASVLARRAMLSHAVSKYWFCENVEWERNNNVVQLVGIRLSVKNVDAPSI